MFDAFRNDDKGWKLRLYFFAIGFFTLIFLIHIFGIASLKTDKFAFFLAAIVLVLLILPVVTSMKFFDIIEVRKDIGILKWKKR